MIHVDSCRRDVVQMLYKRSGNVIQLLRRDAHSEQKWNFYDCLTHKRLIMIVPILKFVYDRRHIASAKKEAPVELRVTFARKSKWMGTGIRLLPKHWHDGTVTNRIDAKELNTILDGIMVKARKVVNTMMDAGELNIDEIPSRMEALTREKRMFVDFCEERAKVRVYGKSADTAERYDRFLKWLRAWGRIVFFSDVNDRNIMQMDEELAKTGMKNYSKWNNYHRFMNSFILDAMDEGLLKRNPYKWLHIEKDKTCGLQKYLTLEEFRRLEKAKMPTDCLDRVRDLFVFQTYTCLSYIDLVDFDPSLLIPEGNASGTTVVYTAKRGNTGKEFVFLLMGGARRILEKYDYKLPLLSNMKYNDYLKLVAQASGIDKKITSHWARHTGATMLLNDGNVDMEVIARVLGHSSTRQTRETYAKLLDRTVVDAMKKFEKRLEKKRKG